MLTCQETDVFCQIKPNECELFQPIAIYNIRLFAGFAKRKSKAHQERTRVQIHKTMARNGITYKVVYFCLVQFTLNHTNANEDKGNTICGIPWIYSKNMSGDVHT